MKPIFQRNIFLGGALELKTNEIDQIIKFDYQTSVFDLIVLSSIKSIILFILITELEAHCKDLLFLTKKLEEDGDESELTNETRDDVELNVKYMGPEHLTYLISILHLSILLISIISVVYPIVKFSFIINTFVKENKMPMDIVFFSICATSAFLSLIQLLFSCTSWHFMKKLESVQLVKREKENEEKKARKINLKRLFSLATPEIQRLFYGFLALVASSSTQIVC